MTLTEQLQAMKADIVKQEKEKQAKIEAEK